MLTSSTQNWLITVLLLTATACTASAQIAGSENTTGGQGSSDPSGGSTSSTGSNGGSIVLPTGGTLGGDTTPYSPVPTGPKFTELWYSSGDSLVYINLNKVDGTVVEFRASPVVGLKRGQNGITMLQDGSILGSRLSGGESQFYYIPKPPRDGSPVTPLILGIMPDAIKVEALYTDCQNRLFAMDTGVDEGSNIGNRLLYISGNYLAGELTYKVVQDFSVSATADIDDLGPGIDVDGNITDNPGFAIDTGTVYSFNYETAIGKLVGKGGTWGIHALGGPLFDDGRSRLYVFSDKAELFLMDPVTFALMPSLGIGPTVGNASFPGHSGLTGPLTHCKTGFTIIL